jgi:hypothetical protein
VEKSTIIEAIEEDKSLTDRGILIIKAMGFCYDKETEILTLHGWKKISELVKTDKVLTLNPKSYLMKYQYPKQIFNYNWKGNLLHFQNRNIDLKVTPNHKLFLKLAHRQKFEMVEAIEASKYYEMKFKKDGKWKGKEEQYFLLPQITGKNVIQKKELDMDVWLEFLGYFIAEGSLSHGYSINISQSMKAHPDICQKIGKCIEKLDYKYSYHDSNFRISNKQLHSYLKNLGHSHEKYVPEIFKQLSPRQLNILYEALVDGDGIRYGSVSGIVSSSKRLMDDIQEILLKMGYCGDIRLKQKKGYKSFMKNGRVIVSKQDSYCIWKNKYFKNPVLSKGKSFKGRINSEFYEDKVFCCEVPYHLVYVRRNGLACWSGNSSREVNRVIKQAHILGLPIFTLTDYDPSGILIDLKIQDSGVKTARLGVDPDLVKILNLKLDDVREALPREKKKLAHYKYLKTKYPKLADGFLKIGLNNQPYRIEIDGIFALAGKDRFVEEILKRADLIVPTKPIQKVLKHKKVPENVNKMKEDMHALVDKLFAQASQDAEKSHVNAKESFNNIHLGKIEQSIEKTIDSNSSSNTTTQILQTTINNLQKLLETQKREELHSQQ